MGSDVSHISVTNECIMNFKLTRCFYFPDAQYFFQLLPMVSFENVSVSTMKTSSEYKLRRVIYFFYLASPWSPFCSVVFSRVLFFFIFHFLHLLFVVSIPSLFFFKVCLSKESSVCFSSRPFLSHIIRGKRFDIDDVKENSNDNLVYC